MVTLTWHACTRLINSTSSASSNKDSPQQHMKGGGGGGEGGESMRELGKRRRNGLGG